MSPKDATIRIITDESEKSENIETVDNSNIKAETSGVITRSQAKKIEEEKKLKENEEAERKRKEKEEADKKTKRERRS